VFCTRILDIGAGQLRLSARTGGEPDVICSCWSNMVICLHLIPSKTPAGSSPTGAKCRLLNHTL